MSADLPEDGKEPKNHGSPKGVIVARRGRLSAVLSGAVTEPVSPGNISLDKTGANQRETAGLLNKPNLLDVDPTSNFSRSRTIVYERRRDRDLRSELPVFNTNLADYPASSASDKVSSESNGQPNFIDDENVGRNPGGEIEASQLDISDEVMMDLRRFGTRAIGGTYEITDSRAQEIKQSLKSALKIPQETPIHLFTDDQGSALSKNLAGEKIIEGHLSLLGKVDSATHIAFEFNVSRRVLRIDGRIVPLSEVAAILASLEASFLQSYSLNHILEMAEERAQTIFFKGIIAGELPVSIVITQNYLSPHDFHVYVGSLDLMKPVIIKRDNGFQHNIGTFITGNFSDGKPVTILIPFRQDGSPHILPSYNGSAITEEKIHRHEVVTLTSVSGQ